MATEDRTRHERLRALFPRAYATDPRDSVLGALLEVLADGLRSFDQTIERALRDKWLATAEPHRRPEGETSEQWLEAALAGEPEPLEHLGVLLDLLRQPWERDEEAYRRRLAVLAPLMTRGLANVRALLYFSLTALGAEPCSGLERSGDGTTTAFGLEPGRRARCATCRGGRIAPTGPCPMRPEHEIMRASLVDNPHRVARLQRSPLTLGPDGTAIVRFTSQSLFDDRPELELSVPNDATGTPFMASFRSHQTGERIVVEHPLVIGDTLSILPRSPHDPTQPARDQLWVDRPAGSNPPVSVARIVHADGQSSVAPITVFRDVVFEGARFDLDRFAPEDATGAGEPEVTVPAIVPGANTWDYIPLGATGASLAVPPPGASPVGTGPVTLRLRWWTRPIARFLVRIPITPTVRSTLDEGAAEHVRRMIHRVRPVGVLPIIDFVEPLVPETLDLVDATPGLGLSIIEPLSPIDDLLDDHEIVPGVFDVTLFDATLLQP